MFALNSRIEASGPHINDMLNYIYIYKIHIYNYAKLGN